MASTEFWFENEGHGQFSGTFGQPFAYQSLCRSLFQLVWQSRAKPIASCNPVYSQQYLNSVGFQTHGEE
jgi:hypothetical protein